MTNYAGIIATLIIAGIFLYTANLTMTEFFLFIIACASLQILFVLTKEKKPPLRF